MNSDQEQRETVVKLLRAFGAADSHLGRQFARQQRMHPTDAAAIVEVLEAERGGELITPARLAERIGLTAGATSTVVNRLEDAGHLVRTRNHSDRRLVGLHTTPQMHAAAEAFFAPVAAALDVALATCSVEQLDVLINVLNALNRLMTDEVLDPRGRSWPRSPA